MKILKIKAPKGYKMLSDGFEVNFLTKTRVDREAENDDLIELEAGLFYPVETVFIGKNSSGKTSTTSLINLAFFLLTSGRIYGSFLPDGKEFELEIIFYHEGQIYQYVGAFHRDVIKNKDYLLIDEEKLGKTVLKPSYKKDLSNAHFSNEASFSPNIGGDTSNISRYKPKIEINQSCDIIGYSLDFFSIFHDVLGEGAFTALARLFDDSIDYIRPHFGANNAKNGYLFKRVDEASELLVDEGYLFNVLSAGTIRGINLYGLSILAFKVGGTIVLDEIERSFNRNLIENLFLMFTDKTINKSQATIIYSTHYSELLDHSNRCDNINVLHRTGNKITLSNVSTDYECRTDLAKSNYFNQNAFDTLINYDRLMDLKEALR